MSYHIPVCMFARAYGMYTYDVVDFEVNVNE